MEIGQKLKAKRMQRDLTQAQLAEAMQVSVKTISNWENGRTIPDVEMMLQLAQVYGISLDDLLMEGSDWVDELKAKEHTAHLKRWYLIGPLATSLVLALMLYLPKYWPVFAMSDAMMGLLLLVILGNGVSVWYLQRELAGDPWLKTTQRVVAWVLLGLLALILLSRLM